jgi:hypothetical protein
MGLAARLKPCPLQKPSSAAAEATKLSVAAEAPSFQLLLKPGWYMGLRRG